MVIRNLTTTAPEPLATFDTRQYSQQTSQALGHGMVAQSHADSAGTQWDMTGVC